MFRNRRLNCSLLRLLVGEISQTQFSFSLLSILVSFAFFPNPLPKHLIFSLSLICQTFDNKCRHHFVTDYTFIARFICFSALSHTHTELNTWTRILAKRDEWMTKMLRNCEKVTEQCCGIMGVLLCTVQLVNISVSLNERHLYSVLFRELNVMLIHEPTICCRHGVYLLVYELVFDQITKLQFVEHTLFGHWCLTCHQLVSTRLVFSVRLVFGPSHETTICYVLFVTSV